MSAKTLSAPTPPKKKRPSFSAPTPPKSDPTEVLSNEDEEISILKEETSEDVVVEKELKKIEMPSVKAETSDDEVDELDEVLDDIEQDEEESYEPVKTGGGGISIINLIIFVLLLLFGLVGWFLYLQEAGVLGSMGVASENEEVVEEVVGEQTQEEVVAPTPEPTIAQMPREEITLEVLNGSGVSGAAGDTAAVLEDLGYPEIEVGNTVSTDENELYVNPDYADMVDVLLEDLADELDISTVSGDLENSDLVGRVVLGG